MKTTNDIDSRIEKALNTATALDFSEDFSEAIIRKIEKAEARSLRIQWIGYASLVLVFTLASLITLLVFMENLSSLILSKGALWVVVIGGLLLGFQIIENKYLRTKALN
ncbi:MAG: hypothetical protein ACJAVY_001577 [Marinoscillum sp.]|jgi:hypothetical protein